MIWGIDGSTVASGYAHGGPGDAAPRGGVWETPGCDEQGGVFDVTLGRIGNTIVETSKIIRPRAVYVEAPMSKIDRYHSKAAALALIQLTGGLRTVLSMLHIRVVLVACFNVRKGFGIDPYLAGKEAKAAVEGKMDEWGWSYRDHNEADAKLTWAHGMTKEYPGWWPNEPLLTDRACT